MNIIQKAFSSVSKLFDNSTDSFSTWIDTYVTPRSKFELLGQYKNLVYSCITAIAEDVARYDPLFYKLDAKGNKKYFIHEFKRVLENPNPFMSQFDLFEATQSFLELTGDAFWYLSTGQVSKKPKEIYLMRPDKVKVAKDNNGKTIGYVFMKGVGKEIPLELYEVIHFKTFNPTDPDRGLGAVQAGLLYIDTENNTSEFQNNFMENQASPSGILELKGKITKEAFLKIKKQWKEANSGVGNVGKTLIIRNTDAEFKKVGLSIGDIDMASLKDITDKRVRGMFRVPKALLGETDSSGLGRANVEAIEYVFAKRVIDPKLTRIDDTLRNFLKSTYNDTTTYIEHASQIPQDKESELRYKQASVNKWKTVNEIRALEGDLPIEGGDKLYVGFNETPIDAEPLDTSTESNKIVVRTAHVCDEHCNHNSKKKVSKSAEDNLVNALERLEQNSQPPYVSKLKSFLNAQQKRVLSILSDNVAKSGADMNVLTKFVDSIVDEVESKSGAITILIEKLVEILFFAYKKSGVTAIEFLDLPDTEFITEQAARDAIFNSTDRLMKSFNEQTALKLQKQIAGGLAAGENYSQIKDRVESVYTEAKGHRAARIAQTEAHKAINFGTAEAYKQAGIRKMQWYAFPSACEFCRKMDGTIVNIGSPFISQGATIEGEDGGEFVADYESVTYGDLHPYCNCKLLPVID